MKIVIDYKLIFKLNFYNKHCFLQVFPFPFCRRVANKREFLCVSESPVFSLSLFGEKAFLILCHLFLQKIRRY